MKWSNGDDFTTEDVEYNFKRWLNPNSKSVNRTQFAGIEFEKTGLLYFKLHLPKSKLSTPEELYAYTPAISPTSAPSATVIGYGWFCCIR